MAKITGASLNKIYNRLNSAPEYHPMEADTYADWSLEAGDTVKVSRDGNDYSSPVHSTSLSWKKSQQMTLSSSGSEERESVSKQSQKKYSSGSSGLRNSQYLHYYVEDQYKGLKAGLEITSSTAALYARDLYRQMTSGLELTSSKAALYVRDQYRQMTSGLELTSSKAALYVRDMYRQMTSGLELTSSKAALYVRDQYRQMTSGLELTSSKAALYVRDQYRQMTSGLELTSSTAALYVRDQYRQMTSGLQLTSSKAALYVRDQYRQMTSGLELTSSKAALYVRDQYRQMTSGLELTSSKAALYVRDLYRQMTSGLELTSSKAALYVRDQYRQMTSGLQLTSSTAALYVVDLYKRMKSGIEITSSSAALYARNRTTRAYIMTRINADGEGEALIEADKVKITGKTTLNDVMIISDSRVFIQKDTRINGDLMLATLTLRGANDDNTINAAQFAQMIKKAEKNGSTITLTRVDGSTLSFNKATSAVLSGSWSGSGKLTVTADVGGDPFERLLIAKSASGGVIPIYAQYGSSGQYEEDTGFNVTIYKTDIDLANPAWYNSSAGSLPSYDANLGTAGALIKKSQLGYLYFTVTVKGRAKTYRMPIDTR